MSDIFDPLDDKAGPARPISGARAQELVRGAISRLLVGDVAPPPRTSVGWGRLLRVAAVVLVFGAGAAVAASLSGLRLWSTGEQPQHPAKLAPVEIQEAAPPEQAMPPVVEGAEEQGARQAPPPPAVERRRDVRSSVRAPVRTPPRARGTGKTAALPGAPSAEVVAEDALVAANRLRLQKQWAPAARAYQDIAGRFAGSDAAYVATVARAQLLLDHLDQPQAALKLFRQALVSQPQGPLTEEVRYDLAACYRLLGDVAGEREALKTFLGVQSSNPRRAAAAARLSELQRQ